MKKFQNLMQKRWFSNAVAGCITVAVYLLLSNIGTVWSGITQFIGYFSTVIGGAAIAYLMNPLAKLYDRKVFRRLKKDSLRWSLSVALAVTTVVLFLILILVILIPQLLESITNFVTNLGTYATSLLRKLNDFGLSFSDSNKAKLMKELLESSEDVLNKLVEYITDNFPKIISASTTAGKGVINWGIAFVISVYLLAAKTKIKAGIRKLMKATMSDKVYDDSVEFLSRCNAILNRYVICDLIDGLIIGAANAVFMAVCGMQYIGLVSVLVGVTNLIPTFGPLVGAVIGTFILLMVNPIHALLFLIFTIILQTIDAVVIKPKLFGNTFGVSGLLILVALVISGKVFGIIGIIFSVPVVAIGDYVYREILIPRLELRKNEPEKDEPPQQNEEDDE
jgi:Predicted permease